MKSALYALCPVVALTMTSCMSSPQSGARHEPYVKPGLVMLTADQAARRGIDVSAAAHPLDTPMPKELESLDASAVTVPPGVKVYTLNRSVDPADRELMHEEHVVYRRESSPHWRLDAPANQKILVGPRITDGRQDVQPLLNKELTSFLANQRHAADADRKAIAALFQAVEALNRQQQALIQHERPKAGPSTLSKEKDPSASPPDGTSETP